MVRMVRVNEAVLSDINTVSDLSYGEQGGGRSWWLR
jgi:hypothetical protein